MIDLPRVWWVRFFEAGATTGIMLVDAPTWDEAEAKIDAAGVHPGQACRYRGEAPELYPPTKRAIVAQIPRLTMLSVERVERFGVTLDDDSE